MAVNRSPVVIGVVRQPGHATAARWMVSIVSVVEQTFPVTRIPPRHSKTIVGGLGVGGRIDPVRSIPAGRKIVWSAMVVMSNPLITSLPWRKTATLSWVPAAPVRDVALVGQLVEPGATRQIVPGAACAW